MKAIKVFINEAERFKMPNLIEKLNGHEDIAMTDTGETVYVVVTTGECAMAYARAVIGCRLKDCTIKTIK